MKRWAPIIGAAALLGYTGAGGERTDVLAHVTGFTSGAALGAAYAMLGERVQCRGPVQVILGAAALSLVALCWVIAFSVSR